jgi:hypothetical protein
MDDGRLVMVECDGRWRWEDGDVGDWRWAMAVEDGDVGDGAGRWLWR